MSNPTPPEWGNDPFSSLFNSAEANDRAAAGNHPEIFRFTSDIHACFKRLFKEVENDAQAVHLVPRFLLIRTHSSIFGALRLAMSGQLSEAYALNRSAIEQAWYALHMATDPSGWARTETWLRRNESDDTKKACKNEFTVKNVRDTHEGLDAVSATELSKQYERTIDYGAHPDQMGVVASIKSKEDAAKVVFNVGVLTPDPQGVMATVRATAAIAIGALKVFQLIFPAEFEAAGLAPEINRLVGELNTLFKQFSSKTA